jgi:hypothetical protein
VELPAAEKRTYGQFSKSSILIGGSSALNIAIGTVRTKAMAVLLGPREVRIDGPSRRLPMLTCPLPWESTAAGCARLPRPPGRATTSGSRD